MTSWKETSFNLTPKLFRHLILVPVLLAIPLLWSCNGINPPESIPSYLYIPEIKLEVAADGSQGSDAHGITDAWVFVNSQLIGVFETPATVPVLASGNAKISISAGIKRNGRLNDRIAYPFYAPFDTSQILVPGMVDTIHPKVKYREAAQFRWIEDFEDLANSFTASNPNATIDSMFITTDPTEVFQWDNRQNTASGKVLLGKGKQYFHNATVNEFNLPKGGNEVFLEANFNSDAALQFGFIPSMTSTFGEIPVFLGFPTDGEWRKVYISLKEDISVPDFSRDNFKIFLSSYSDAQSDTARILIDNFKILFFE